VIVPIMSEFKPDIILVSAGFDSALDDPLGALELSPDMFGFMTRQLMECPSSSGKVVLFLEGKLWYLIRFPSSRF